MSSTLVSKCKLYQLWFIMHFKEWVIYIFGAVKVYETESDRVKGKHVSCNSLVTK